MKVSFEDEKTMTIVALIAAMFMIINVDPTIGLALFGMAAVYGIAINSNRAEQFIKDTKNLPLFVGISVLAVGGFLLVSTYAFSVQPLSVFASAFSFVFTTANPLIKFVIFGFVVPLLETLFFLLVVYPLLARYIKAKGSFHDFSTYIAAGLTGLVAAGFHLAVRFWSPNAFIVDLAFFAISAMIVAFYKEGKHAFAMHSLVNAYVVGNVVGYW